MKPIAIIPARGGSKRIPRKNIVDINGKPMIAYAIETALKSEVFSEVIVSTEDAEIKEISQKYGARVVDRPDELATDIVFETDVYKHVLSTFDELPSFFCGIYATAIFIEPQDLRDSFAMIEEDSDVDILMSTSRYQIHPFKALRKNDQGYMEMVYPKECLMRSQTYPDYVASNGTFYWCKIESYLKNPSYYPEKLKAYILPSYRGLDIDEPEDLEIARAMKMIRR